MLNRLVAELEKQTAKGYTEEHDDKHTDGSLGHAAGIILVDVVVPDDPLDVFGQRRQLAKMGVDSWCLNYAMKTRRESDIDRLIIAAGLILAEAARRDRAHRKAAE